MLHTADGGRTWALQKSHTIYTLSSICFVDPQTGWAVGDRDTIIHTADGGRTWVKQGSPVNYILMDVEFISSTTGWIVTEWTHILHTQDGGRTWQVQFTGGEDYILKAISFHDSQHGWAVGEYGYIYGTRDGGMTWEKQAVEFRIDEETGMIIADKYLFDVAAVDKEAAWAVGIGGRITVTRNGGQVWTPAESGARETHLFCVTADNQGRILAGGTDGVFLSSLDNGRTWQKNQKFNPSITYGWLYGLTDMGDSGNHVAVGWSGRIYVSGSNTWEMMAY